MSGGLFKMNVLTTTPKAINESNNFVYLLKSSNIWHASLGHVNFGTLRRLVNLEYIPKFTIDSNHRCKTCIEAKMTIASVRTTPTGMSHELHSARPERMSCAQLAKSA